MNSKFVDNYGTRAALRASQTLLSDDAAACDDLHAKSAASWLSREGCKESACASHRRPSAGPNLPNICSSTTRMVYLQGMISTDTVCALLSQFMMNEWPTAVHLVESSRLSATIFVDFAPVKVEARVAANPGWCGTELAFVNNSISPDMVLFGNVVHRCEKYLRIQFGELCEGSQLRNELLEEGFDFELEDEDVESWEPKFQDLLEEVVHCPSAKVREELLQSLVHLARSSMACSRLADVFGSSIGIFAVCWYLRPQGGRQHSLAEIYPFAYLLRQAAFCANDVSKIACLKGIIADATHTNLVAKELELLLTYLPDPPNAQEEADANAKAPPAKSMAL